MQPSLEQNPKVLYLTVRSYSFHFIQQQQQQQRFLFSLFHPLFSERNFLSNVFGIQQIMFSLNYFQTVTDIECFYLSICLSFYVSLLGNRNMYVRCVYRVVSVSFSANVIVSWFCAFSAEWVVLASVNTE